MELGIDGFFKVLKRAVRQALHQMILGFVKQSQGSSVVNVENLQEGTANYLALIINLSLLQNLTLKVHV
jgi:hypothetical protein